MNRGDQREDIFRNDDDRRKFLSTLKEGCQKTDWHVIAWRKGDNGKVMLRRRLRQETTLNLKWIAQRLQMGRWTYVSNLLHVK
jgi:hypothetical protein